MECEWNFGICMSEGHCDHYDEGGRCCGCGDWSSDYDYDFNLAYEPPEWQRYQLW